MLAAVLALPWRAAASWASGAEPACLQHQARATAVAKCGGDMQIRAKIVDGRIAKIKAQQALLEQTFIRAEDGSSVADAVKEKIAELGENITVRRFVRYELGEGIAKKEEDFAAEVAAQTEKKDSEPAPAPVAEKKVCPLKLSQALDDLRMTSFEVV